MSNKINYDEDVEEMIDEVISHADRKGRTDEFIESLKEWGEEKGFLTDKQYRALCDRYDRCV